ncbi:heavy metal-binding domain-containing protein [Dictyobacter arantiisoli]|uniref:Heavy metal-binding domain-containing protein n=1 Tax=Dictyobacter arantiisoli TaxID=2014874 RepID=A0A5A5T8Q9_9CHLR|nr:heavy metal-binding domain-containing protein [Dictyobacter arantiisoli]GCF07556.1 hypothetical protein KDI_11200 [Dictyobacter arantiisoli]
MPFWNRQTPEEKQRLLQQQQLADVSRQSLEAGGLPTRAQQRLQEETQKGHSLFTSDLSTNELLLAREQGYQPLSQVMGSSIYQVGWQYTRQYSYNTQVQEMRMVSGAHQEAARLALNRLEQEAIILKAHGVIGVRFVQRDYAWGSNLIEYTAIGTAIKLPDTPLHARPFLSDLSGQEFWTLLQAGYYPAGVVTGYSSYWVSLGSQLTQQLRGWWGGGGVNQEIGPFTQVTYDACHQAMQRATAMAHTLNAVGIVGMHIDNNRRIEEYETDNPKRNYLDLFVHFSVLGTAIIARKKDHTIPTPRPTLMFTDLRPGRYGQNRELTFNG